MAKASPMQNPTQHDRDRSPASRRVLDPKHTFSEEKIRGIVTSIASGGISGGINFGLTAAGLSGTLSAFIGLYLIGSILGYTFDILFAKKFFKLPKGYEGIQGPYKGPVHYRDLYTRFMWLLSSFKGKQFFRYIITVIIDTLIGIVILRAVIEFMNRKKFLMEFAYRDAIVAGLISVGTFILYNNVLRFDWAYSDVDDPIMNIMVLMWSTLILVIFAISFNNNGVHSSNPLQGQSQNIPVVVWNSLLEENNTKKDILKHVKSNNKYIED